MKYTLLALLLFACHSKSDWAPGPMTVTVDSSTKKSGKSPDSAFVIYEGGGSDWDSSRTGVFLTGKKSLGLSEEKGTLYHVGTELYHIDTTPKKKIDQRDRVDNVFTIDSAMDRIAIDTNIIAYNGGIYILGDSTLRPDTVRVIMLVCDTSRPISKFQEIGPLDENVDKSGITFKVKTDPILGDYTYDVFWIMGYQTDSLELKRAGVGMDFFEETPVYLDEKKKPLPKNIVVWISEPLKQ